MSQQPCLRLELVAFHSLLVPGYAMRVTAIIPALDEEGAIGETVARLDRSMLHEVIVVNNGSRDRTAERAAAAGARLSPRPAARTPKASLRRTRSEGAR